MWYFWYVNALNECYPWYSCITWLVREQADNTPSHGIPISFHMSSHHTILLVLFYLAIFSPPFPMWSMVSQTPTHLMLSVCNCIDPRIPHYNRVITSLRPSCAWVTPSIDPIPSRINSQLSCWERQSGMLPFAYPFAFAFIDDDHVIHISPYYAITFCIPCHSPCLQS